MKHFLAAIALPSLLAVGCVTDADQPQPQAGDDDTTNVPATDTGPFWKSCKEVAAHDPKAGDGEYTLHVQNQPGLRWTAYCADLQSAPREYLTLPAGAGKNMASYTANGSTVTTVYERVRIDPDSLSVDISDMTFATSTGAAMYKTTRVAEMPFGIAMSCGGVAHANLDLSGTPFRPEDRFPSQGAPVPAQYKLSPDGKAIDLSIDGGSGCSWVGPQVITDPMADSAGTYPLRLGFLPL